MTLCIPWTIVTTKTKLKHALDDESHNCSISCDMYQLHVFYGTWLFDCCLHAHRVALLEHNVYEAKRRSKLGKQRVRGENTCNQGRKGCDIFYLSFIVLRLSILIIQLPLKLRHLYTHYHLFILISKGSTSDPPKFSSSQRTQLSYCA